MKIMVSEDEAVSKLKARGTAEHRKGTDTELLTITSTTTTSRLAKLFVLCGDRFEGSRAFRAGDLSVRIIRLSGNPVSMVTCMVGDHQWMLAKDSMALRVGARAFVFALPGLLYGLALPAGGQLEIEAQCKMLEEIFASFSAYQDLVGKDESKPDDQKSESDNWASAYAKILNLAARASAKIATPTTASPAAKSPADTALRKIQRAVRMSAGVKLVSRALLSGALTPSAHLHVSAAPGARHAYPTMWAVADIVDAIEAGWPQVRARRVPMPGFWGFKEEGVVMILEILKAYGNGGVSGAREGRKRQRVGGVAEEEDGVAEEEDGGGKRSEDGGSPTPCGGELVAEEVEKRVGACGKS